MGTTLHAIVETETGPKNWHVTAMFHLDKDYPLMRTLREHCLRGARSAGPLGRPRGWPDDISPFESKEADDLASVDSQYWSSGEMLDAALVACGEEDQTAVARGLLEFVDVLEDAGETVRILFYER